MRTPSHSYEFGGGVLLREIVVPLAGAALLGLSLRVAGHIGLLPRPWSITDTDRTIVLHQAAAAENGGSAEIVLLGDSAGLIDVDPLLVQEESGMTALSLATLSYVRTDGQVLLLRQYLASAARLPRIVLMVFHPSTLRWPASEAYYLDLMRSWWRHQCPPPDTPGRRVIAWLGADCLRDRLLTRGLLFPVSRAFFPCHGFTRRLWIHMDERHGGLCLCPAATATATPSRRLETRLARSLATSSQDLRSLIPPACRLVVALAPVPSSREAAALRRRLAALLHDWGEMVGADEVLEDLPRLLPPSLFADERHLNRAGAELFSRRVARRLRALLRETDGAATGFPRAPVHEAAGSAEESRKTTAPAAEMQPGP